MRKYILGVLLLVLVTNVAGATDFDYAIDEDLSNVWIKGDWIEGMTSVYVEKCDGYAPEPRAVYDIYENGEIGVPGDLWTFVAGTEQSIGYTTSKFKFGSKSMFVDGTKAYYVTNVNAPEDFTLECYLLWETTEQNGFLCTKAGTPDYTFYAHRNRGGDTEIYRFITGSDYSLLDSNTAPEPGATVWQKYTIVRSGSTELWYIDDVLQTSISDSVLASDRIGIRTGTSGCGVYIDELTVRKYYATEETILVFDRGDYYEIVVDCPESRADYQVAIPCDDLGITSTTESVHFTDVDLAEPEEPEPEPDVPYDPTPGGRYSDQFATIFPNDDAEMTAWGMVKNCIGAWGMSIGSEIFWLFILPLPILAYWIMTNSTELPIVVYLILGGIFVKVAPEVMQTPARIMLMFGITGVLYHVFKNRG